MKTDHISAVPLVSAVVPAYNAEHHLEQTLHALVTQSYANLEIIVVDDGSEDKTLQITKTMAHRYPQLRVIQQPNRGSRLCTQSWHKEARGEFIAPIDADDIWFPDAVLKLANCLLNSDARTGVAYGWSVTLDEDGLLDGGLRCSKIAGDVLGTLICHNFLGNASATLIRRECFEKVGGYDPQFRTESTQGCEDWDVYLRIAQYYQFTVVPEFLFGYRRLRSGMSSNAHAMAKSHRYLLEKVKLRHPNTPQAFHQLSKSSYYLYLARECNAYNNPNESLHWLRQAVVNSSAFTLIRFGFYWLIVKNFFALLGPSIRRFIGYSDQRTSVPRTAAFPSRGILQVADIEKKQTRILLKLAAEAALHRLVKWLPLRQQERRRGTDRANTSYENLMYIA